MKTIDLNNSEKPENTARLCCIISFLAYCTSYTGRSTLSTLATELNNADILSTQLFGIACSLFSIIYACGRFICGYCGDLIPAKKLIVTGVMIAGICNSLIGLTLNPYAILILWTIHALVQSMVYGPLLVVAAAVCTPENKTRYMVFIGLSATFGNVMGFLVIPTSVELFGLGAGFYVPGLLSILSATIVILFLPVVPAKGKLSDLSGKTIIDDLKFFFTNREYLSMLFPCMTNGLVRDGITVWLASFIMKTYGIDLSSLAGFAIAVPIINSLGKFIFPYLYKAAKQNELRVGSICYVCVVIVIIPLCFGLKNPVMAIICLALGSMITAMANLAFVGMWPLRFASVNKVSLASGMIDCPIYLGSGISSALFGFSVVKFGFKSIFITIVICALLTLIPLVLSQKQNTN